MNEIDSKKNKNNYNLKLSLKLSKSKYTPTEEIQGLLLVEINENENDQNKLVLDDILQSGGFQIIFQEKIAYHYSENKSQIYILDKKPLQFNENEIIKDKKSAKISIKYKLPDETLNYFYPTFRYFSNSIKCIITHAIQVELPLKSKKTSVNIFIRKLPKAKIDDKKDELDKVIFKDETIKKYNLFNKGRLAYLIKTKKGINYQEKLPVEIHIDERELDAIKIESITMNIKKNIYLYNDIHMYNNSLETSFNKRKIYLNKNEKNNIIEENLELPKTEFIPLSQNDIQKLNYADKTFNFTPPVDNILFKCEYCLQVILNFNSKLMKTKIIDIPIDYYEIKKNNCVAEQNEVEHIIVNDNDGSDIEFNEIFGKENNDKNNGKIIDKIDNDINDFTEITKKDFINAIDGKKN